MPKHTDDKDARDAARSLVSANDSTPDDIIAAFPVVAFDSSDSRVNGETVTLRRVHMVGPWEVVK
jgi:hypothetical protein